MAVEPQLLSNNAYECNSTIQDTTNQRIAERNVPSQQLQPYLSVRPVMTKYSIMPIVDPRAHADVPMRQMPVYSVSNVFNPGNTMSPWSGYASNVNRESELRNQIYARQACPQAVYVPSSRSDLYESSWPGTGASNMHPYGLLFKKESFDPFNPNPHNLGTEFLYNDTRQQVRGLTNQSSCL
jgi:hypothetical protein